MSNRADDAGQDAARRSTGGGRLGPVYAGGPSGCCLSLTAIALLERPHESPRLLRAGETAVLARLKALEIALDVGQLCLELSLAGLSLSRRGAKLCCFSFQGIPLRF